MVELANELTETEEVVFAFPNFVSELKRKAVPKSIKAQWHLRTVKAPAAWASTQGEGLKGRSAWRADRGRRTWT
jgi:hypothetical protein